jgi:hypothetical protein
VRLGYPTPRGVIFENLGILLTAFMAGLALGSAGIDRLSVTGERWHRTRGTMLAGGIAALSALVMLDVRLGWGMPLGAAMVALVLAGGLVGALFAWASLAEWSDKSRAAPHLYAADLTGGCAGALVAPLVLVPFLSLDAAAGVSAVAGLLAMLLMCDFRAGVIRRHH